MGIRERKQREFASRQELILETAKLLFTQNGFNQVTLEEIAKKIEFSKGTLYSHFQSKEEIYARILLETLQSLYERLVIAVKPSDDSLTGIKRCVEAYIQFYRQHRENFRMLFFIDIFADQTRIEGTLRKQIQDLKWRCLTVLEQIIKNGIQTRQIHPGYSPRKTALTLWGMANGLMNLVETGQITSKSLDSFINIGFNLVTHGLKDLPQGG